MASERSHRWPIASCFLENSAGSSSSKDAKKAQAFYGEVLGWKVQPFPMGDSTYEMIYAAETMIGGCDPPDALAPRGGWCWNELHTSDPKKALAFYEKVFGFAHRSLVGPDVTYHIISQGGVDRGGVTDVGGERPNWLPHVALDDADATLARARKLGGTICAGPEDIPNVGRRFGVLQDPTGPALAILKPFPMQKQRQPARHRGTRFSRWRAIGSAERAVTG